jgi:hypothetical protein
MKRSHLTESLNNIQFLRISFVVGSHHELDANVPEVYANHVFRFI